MKAWNQTVLFRETLGLWWRILGLPVSRLGRSGLAFPYTPPSLRVALPLSFYIWRFYIKLWKKDSGANFFFFIKTTGLDDCKCLFQSYTIFFTITRFKCVYFIPSQKNPPHIWSTHCFLQAFFLVVEGLFFFFCSCFYCKYFWRVWIILITLAPVDQVQATQCVISHSQPSSKAFP